MSALRYGQAPKLLQAHYDQHGPDCFEFSILKEFPPDQVHEREREAIAALRPELNIYGSRPRALTALHDVAGETLSVAQIASRAGVGEETIRARLERGLSGEALLAPKHRCPRKPYTRRK